MADRHVIVVDTETSGLDPEQHHAVEVAWHNLVTGESGYFVPYHSCRLVLANAQFRALQLNRYIDRLVDAEQDDGTQVLRLADALHGNTLAASNPAFDAAFLAPMFADYEGDDRSALFQPVWHHRLLDLSAYAAGVLGLAPSELPGLDDVCERLGVVRYGRHTAQGDVAAAVACFRALAG